MSTTTLIEHIYARRFLDRLNNLLVHRNLSNPVVEKRGGLSANAIASIMYRIRVDPGRFYSMEFRTMMRVAKGCNVNVFWLFWGIGQADVFTDMLGGSGSGTHQKVSSG